MLTEIDSPQALATLLTSSRPHVCVVYSATWCGPCKASHPQLQALAAEFAADSSLDLVMALVYEHVLGDAILQYQIRAFPTYVLYQNGGTETARVQGANIPALRNMILQGNCHHANKMPTTGGTALGGGTAGTTDATPPTAEAARAARLAKFGAGSGSAGSNPQPPPSSSAPVKNDNDDVEDTPMKEENEDNNTADDNDTAMAVDQDETTPTTTTDPTDSLDPTLVQTLTESMGFSLLRAQKGLLYGNQPPTVETAVEWLLQHQDDPDIDEPIGPNATAVTAQSYKCNECGKILSNMANLELHANKTGHSDFEESTQAVTPLTAEEKLAKMAEIKSLLAAKRAQREQAEKADNVIREKQRRNMGKEMSKTREQMEIEARKRAAQQRKREKAAFQQERARLRAELAKDKAERAANAGKLQSRLGVEGYQPDGIQYDVPVDGGTDANAMDAADSSSPSQTTTTTTTPAANMSKIENYIQKVSSYRAGGDGGKCLKILKTYVGNVVDNPNEAKFKTINMENKAFKTKVKPFIGAKQLLLAVGFQPNEAGTALELPDDKVHLDVLAQTKTKLEAALVAYG